jgi:hypothetical protein
MGINIVYFLIALINFIFCYTSADLGDYTDSPVYVTAIFVQIFMSILLTSFMLHAGLKLYSRIQGAVGNLDPNYGQYNPQSSGMMAAQRGKSPVFQARESEGSIELKSALTTLNLVMSICSACFTLQVVMIILNYALGYADSTSKTVGPDIFYWYSIKNKKYYSVVMV